MNSASWRVEHGPVGITELEINGEVVDTSNIVEAHVDLVHGDVSCLVLVYRNREASMVTGEGIVHVASVEAQALEELDAEAIEAEALSKQGWGSDQSLTATIIDIIKEKVCGP
jgi:hypothetical protein